MEKNSTSSRIIEAYFTPRRFERDGTIYKALGVRTFKKYVPTGGDIAILKRKKQGFKGIINESSVKALKAYESDTRMAETVHLAGAVGFGYAAIGSLVINQPEFGVLIMGANVLANLYPIMLQRYNRGRVYRILEKKEHR